MTNRTIVGGLAAISIVGILGLFISKSSNTVVPIVENTKVLPILKVLAGPVYRIVDDKQAGEMKDGDILTPITTLEVGDGGRALIYFGDGSSARLDSNTRVAIKAGEYEKSTGKLTAKLFVSVGRMWSKIIELTTPDSAWEVETSRAVATVRGTAFATIVEKNKTRFLGSENDVAVKPFDYDKLKWADEHEVTLKEKTFVEISDETVKNALSGKKEIPVLLLTGPLTSDPWVKENQKIDNEINTLYEDLKDDVRLRGTSDLRDELQKSVDTLSREFIMGSTSTVVTSTTPKTTLPRATTTATTTKPVVSGTRLEVVASTPLSGIIEGQQIVFKAFLVLADGTKREVTREAKWEVLGSIGSVVAGSFTAKLDASVAELGSSSGAVIATWTDPKTVVPYLGKSAIFSVGANITVPLGTDG